MVANYAIEHFNLDEVHLIVSPQNPFKEQKDLLDIDDRLMLANYATLNNNKIIVNQIEKKLPIPSYTSNTLKHICEGTKDCEFYLIMGLDTFLTLDKWNDVEYILSHNIIVFPRVKSDNDENPLTSFNNQLQLINKNFNVNSKITYANNAIINNISSTFIRNEIKNNKSIQYYVPHDIINLIKAKKLYLK
jgi:nicotinate-nucleotide adenylyltransferase